jgi:hypothetical protein
MDDGDRAAWSLSAGVAAAGLNQSMSDALLGIFWVVVPDSLHQNCNLKSNIY